MGTAARQRWGGGPAFYSVKENNPTLMRLRELEALEKIASAGNLDVVLGEQGLANRIVNLL